MGGIMYSVVIPVYNGAETVTALAEGISDLFDRIDSSFEVIFVDDHSEDNSWDIIRGLAAADSRIAAIKLAANYGQHNATICGLYYVVGDFIITMDDDLQHSPEDIPKLIREMDESGADVVIARLVNKKHDWRRRKASDLMRQLNELFAKKPKGLHLSSFRLMKKEIAEKMLRTGMSYIFIPALIFGVTQNVVNTEVEHRKRQYGNSGYSFGKMVGLAARLFINANPVLRRLLVNKRLSYVVEAQAGSLERRKSD
ncbi:glycosyltransferase family 2 protein [Phosphitispora fastidiosa]|uniref:glycosyltransferase family 2 protein n=1 Tax=Phosphitispora fastidiosa TaxID=2837202 RepID=UPI001E40DD0E|nr:glycosyltransferase family 2 protein [Phosphitispora fastidiosa]MBU7005332.1 glycosyltransferase involved in cell wall biosynthesis [Phosphitispora fastidiosa]